MFYYLAFATEKETTPRRGISSYALKHYAERFPERTDVYNGIAILASIMVGLPVKKPRKLTPNAMIGVKILEFFDPHRERLIPKCKRTRKNGKVWATKKARKFAAYMLRACLMLRLGRELLPLVYNYLGLQEPPFYPYQMEALRIMGLIQRVCN